MTCKKMIIIAGIIAAFSISGCGNPANSRNGVDNAGMTGNNGVTPLSEPGGNYRVIVQPAAHGIVTLDKPSGIYAPDEMVALTIEPDDGFECAYLRAVITDAVNAPIGGNLSDRTRLFRMPTANVIVYAGFVLKSRNAISVGEQVHGSIVSISHTEAAFSNIVTVTLQPNAGYELEAGGLKVIGNKSGSVVTGNRTARRDEYSFLMPPEPVTVHAFFFDPSKEQFAIQVDVPKDQSGNTVVVKGMAAADETVTIAMYLKDDHMLLEKPSVTSSTSAALTVTQNTVDPTKWQFTMPAAAEIETGDSILVKASWRMIPMYAVSAGIAETSAGEGRFIVEGLNNAGKIAPGGDLRLTLRIHDAENYYYRQGSVEVLDSSNSSLAGRLIPVEDNWNGTAVVWQFAVPEAEPAAIVETLRVSAVIDGIPAHAITFSGLDDNGKKAGTIEISPAAFGKDIAAGEVKAREGKTITAILRYDNEDYTLAPGSFKVSRTGSGQEIQAQREGETKLTFLMHPQALTVSAGLSAKPFIPITKKNDDTGAIRLEYASASGPKENAREAYTISVYAVPTSGYNALSTSPVVTPAVPDLQKGANNVWTFTMPANTVDVQWTFLESGNVEIFKGGPKLAGMTVGETAWPYGKYAFAGWNNTDGRTPGTAAIKIGPNSNTAGMTYAGEIGFSLNVPEAIDASWAGALSFYMKRESGAGALGNAWVGFGDGNLAAIWYGNNNDQVINVSNEWTRYIVPVPAPRDGMKMKRVFFWKANANANWLIDDIEFISAAQVELDSISIPAANPQQLTVGETYEAYRLINSRIGFTYKTNSGDQASATLFNTPGDGAVTYNWGSWIPTRNYTYKIYGAAATLSDGIVTPVTQGGNFKLTLILGQKESNQMSLDIERDDLKILESFELYAPNRGQNGYWDEMLWREWGNGSNVYSGNHSGVYKYLQDAANSTNPEAVNQKDPPRTGRNFAAVDISGFTTLSFWIKAIPASTEANTLSFMLSNDASGNTPSGTLRSVNFTITSDAKETGANGFKRIDIPLASFTGLDLTRVTGWAFSVTGMEGCTDPGTTTYEYQFALDEIMVKK